MIRRPPRSTRTDTLFPSRRSSDLWRESGAAGRTGNVGSGMRAHQSVADAEPGAEAIVELLGLGPADYRPGQHPGQGALVGLDGFGEGAETGSAQLIAFGDGLGGIAEGADLDGKADADGRRSEEHKSELQSRMR